jgi:hypothetical protein
VILPPMILPSLPASGCASGAVTNSGWFRNGSQAAGLYRNFSPLSRANGRSQWQFWSVAQARRREWRLSFARSRETAQGPCDNRAGR